MVGLENIGGPLMGCEDMVKSLVMHCSKVRDAG